MVMLIFAAASMPSPAQVNLLRNGGFEEESDKPFGWPGWHTYIGGFMPKVMERDEDGKPTYNYICGCGENLGEKKPYVGMICPACGRYMFPEETGAKYDNNHKHVTLTSGRTGRGIKMTISEAVGSSQGVRCISDLVQVRRDWPYEFGVDVCKRGVSVRIFVEGFRLPDEIRDNEEMPEEEKLTYLERSYRMQINTGASTDHAKGYGGGWDRYSRVFMPPYKTERADKYKIDYVQVKLYGYMWGEAWFDNVTLRQLSPPEAVSYVKKNLKKEHAQDWIEEQKRR